MMIVDVFWVILPVLAALWSMFVAKTGRLNPLAPIAARANRMGILGMWVPGPAKRVSKSDKAKAELKAVGMGLAVPAEPVKTYETYGHPAPPIPLLGASLPTAPIGYGWEITTVLNEDGNPALRLAMLDLATTIVVDAIEADMVIVRRWRYAADDTYASFYRRAKAQAESEIIGYKLHGNSYYRQRSELIYNKDSSELVGKVMMANLINPMVDWARVITLRYIVEHPDETKCNYMLIESSAVS